MNSGLLLNGDYINEEGTRIKNGYLLIRDQKIVFTGEKEPDTKGERIEKHVMPAGAVIIPGMIDIHIHGVGGADVMDGTQEALEVMAKALPEEGTTSFLPTTMTEKEEQIEKALTEVSFFMKNQKPGVAEVIGIHLEGPFISEKRAGAQPREFIKEPDIKTFQRWQALAEDQIKLLTLAPEEKKGTELATYLKENNIIASIGHSDASFDQVKKGIKAGISHVTHLFNGMRGMHHRDPGVAGAAFLRDELMVEMIVDGIHAVPEMIRLAYCSTGPDRTVLITDSMRAKGMGDGTFTLGGQQVTVNDKRAELEDGTLAGSILRMDDAVCNMMHYTDCSIEEIVKMTSVNPAKELNLFDRKGSLSEGKDADITILKKDLNVYMTICRGKISYQRKEA